MVRTAAIGIRVEPDIKAALEKAAMADRRTVASMAEKILVEYLEANGYLATPASVRHPSSAVGVGRALLQKPPAPKKGK